MMKSKKYLPENERIQIDFSKANVYDLHYNNMSRLEFDMFENYVNKMDGPNGNGGRFLGKKVKCSVCGKGFNFWDFQEDYSFDQVITDINSKFNGYHIKFRICCHCFDILMVKHAKKIKDIKIIDNYNYSLTPLSKKGIDKLFKGVQDSINEYEPYWRENVK